MGQKSENSMYLIICISMYIDWFIVSKVFNVIVEDMNDSRSLVRYITDFIEFDKRVSESCVIWLDDWNLSNRLKRITENAVFRYRHSSSHNSMINDLHLHDVIMVGLQHSCRVYQA